MTGTVNLKRALLFETLHDEELDLISSVVEYRLCPPETVVLGGSPGDRSLFVVLSGSVRIVKPDALPDVGAIAEVLPGQHFGEVSFVDGGQRTASAITNETTELLVLDPRRFVKLAESRPMVGYKVAWSLLRMLCGRMRDTNFWLFGLMGNGPRQI